MFLQRIPTAVDMAAQAIDAFLFGIDVRQPGRRLSISGYARFNLVVGFLLIFFSAYGSGPEWRGLPLAIVLILAMYIAFIAGRIWSARLLLAFQWLALLVLFLSQVWLGGIDGRSQEPEPFLSTYALLTLLWTAGTVFSGFFLVRRCLGESLRDHAGAFRAIVDSVDIDEDVVEPSEAHRATAISRAFFLVPAREPISLIVPAALTAMAAPAKDLHWAVPLALFLSWATLALGLYDAEKTAFVRLIRRCFASGFALVPSAIVAALGFLRLIEFDYVRTVLDSLPAHIVLATTLSFYALAWFHSTWIQRYLGVAVLDLLRDRMQRPHAAVLRTRRAMTIAVHGVYGLAVDQNGRRSVHPPTDLLYFMTSAARRKKIDPSGYVLRRQGCQVIAQRLRIGALLGAVLPVLFVLTGWYFLHGDDQRVALPPAAIVAQQDATGFGLFSLQDALSARLNESEPVLFVAASGGGTRAAIYVGALLRGLALRGMLPRYIFGSGVSGGAFGLCAFAAREHELEAPEGLAWRRYLDVLSHPYFDETLRSIGEWRLLRGESLGAALEERFLVALDANRSGGKVFLGQSQRGLAIHACVCAAQNPLGAPWVSDLGLPLLGDARYPDPNRLATGARLTLGNLTELHSRLPPARELGWNFDLPIFQARAPGVRLATAAALSSNFPPVFKTRWVEIPQADGTSIKLELTDGGGLDNRGVIELLSTLEYTLARMAPAGDRNLPPVVVLVAEASGVGVAPDAQGGVEATRHAAPLLADRVIADALLRCRDLYLAAGGREGEFRVGYLPMPAALRSARAFGTHWMMPPTIAVIDTMGSGEALTLPAQVVRDLIWQLFDPDWTAWRDIDRQEASLLEIETAWRRMVPDGVRSLRLTLDDALGR